MLQLDLCLNTREESTILCLGAHSDDIEIGAGATLLSLGESYPSTRITWVVFAGHGRREDEARASAEYFTAQFASAHIVIHHQRDGYFPAEADEIKARFETLKQQINPQVVLTHYREDRHQDHRLISDLTWQTFRNHLILEYEIPKYDGDFGIPNAFFPLRNELREAKLRALQRYFGSQSEKQWFHRSVFDGVMRLRGMECNSRSGYAEAFYCRKAVINAAAFSDE